MSAIDDSSRKWRAVMSSASSDPAAIVRTGKRRQYAEGPIFRPLVFIGPRSFEAVCFQRLTSWLFAGSALVSSARRAATPTQIKEP
jgi:hypothetical protein